jgi:hypothetical protein
MDGNPALIIGWKEYVDFPDWGVRKVRAKVDTGAQTSALDTENYELIQCADGAMRARILLRVRSKRVKPRVVEVPVLAMVQVRSSNGGLEQRPVIESTVRLGPVRKLVRFTLARRVGMRYRVLLGRTALAPEFVVDVSRKYLQRGDS